MVYTFQYASIILEYTRVILPIFQPPRNQIRADVFLVCTYLHVFCAQSMFNVVIYVHRGVCICME